MKSFRGGFRPFLSGNIRVIQEIIRVVSTFCLLSGVAATCEPGLEVSAYMRGEALRIGNEVQLLADDYVVEDRWKLTREVGRVIKHLRNPVLVQDKPWEGQIGMVSSVFYDEKLQKFRMYYDSFNLTNYFNPREGAPSYAIAYAESDDGFKWYKPALEGFPYGNYPRTNILNSGLDGKRAGVASVFLNPDQSDPARRFMIVYLGGGARLAYSADGLHWDTLPEPLLRYHSDFNNHLLYVPELKLWYMYVRPFVRSNGRGDLPEGPRHTSRRLALTTSPDLKNWSPPRIVLYPDERDEPDYNGVSVFRRHGLFIGMYSQMAQEHGGSEQEVYLATSRDGIHWQRTEDRKPFLSQGIPGSFDQGEVGFTSSPPIEIGEEMYLYYRGTPEGESSFYSESAVGVCRFRKDRFIGQRAGDLTGYLLTKELVLEGSKLVLNCSSLPRVYHTREQDGIRVAIFAAPDYGQDGGAIKETAIPGFALEDCDVVTTDSTTHTVTWKRKSDLSSLKGRSVYLRFQMKGATLYSFQIAP
jgi:hypothetical protein